MSKMNTAVATTTTVLLLAYIGAADRITRRDRSRDRGHNTLEFVIIAAGVCVLAIAVVVWIGPVVQRYLTRIT